MLFNLTKKTRSISTHARIKRLTRSIEKQILMCYNKISEKIKRAGFVIGGVFRRKTHERDLGYHNGKD